MNQKPLGKLNNGQDIRVRGSAPVSTGTYVHSSRLYPTALRSATMTTTMESTLCACIDCTMTMLSTLWTTLRYTFAVRGYYATPVSSFPTRMGCKSSDMFRVSVTESESADGITLQEFHAAFLSSPVFRTELRMLSMMGAADPELTSKSHIDVASGEKSTFGPWTSWAVDGSREKAVTAQSDPASACVVMRCYISGKPFCDTWWAVEKTPDNKLPELVFGTAMKAPYDGKGSFMSSLLLAVLDPFHRLYSRILLASAKAAFLDIHQQRLASARAALQDLHEQRKKQTTTNEKAD
jgi:hypothetical protein